MKILVDGADVGNVATAEPCFLSPSEVETGKARIVARDARATLLPRLDRGDALHREAAAELRRIVGLLREALP